MRAVSVDRAAADTAPGDGSSRRERVGFLLLLVAAGAFLYAGWRVFWFLTDDAFIAFRYVSNSRLGYGYVWNPPPFHPVEGYTSFLWVVLLDGLWRLFGTPPPRIANDVSLFCAFLTLLLGAFALLRICRRPEWRPWRLAFLALVLFGAVTNRTFLAWSSSGFETAMFNLLLLVWWGLCLQERCDGWGWVLLLSATTAALALARPDGLLFAGATLAILAALGASEVRSGRGTAGPPMGHRHPIGRWVPEGLACTPLVVIPLHLLWRRWTYGAWLPNTYYAKFVGAWPESGVRYALSFVLEYALWFWLVVVAVACLRPKSLGADLRPKSPVAATGTTGPSRRAFVRGACFAAVGLHLLYYTLVIGGDHFEYRVYSHLVLPILLSFVWALSRLRLRPGAALALLAAFVLLSEPVPWSQWALTRRLSTRQETRRMRVALAPHWPGPVRWYARGFDALQSWLIGHWVCVRHQEHKINAEYLTSLYPTRAEGEALPPDGFPVLAFQAVGVASWTLPGVNILDLLGLNDRVIARAPVEAERFRGMAHERTAPEGYVDCFRPNVFLARGGGVRIVARDPPLTAADIRTCEETWEEKIRGARRPPGP